ncbi:MAG: aminotransferase class I/II-fold pyridoxal phosphate-dependent enzyme [Saprospiraceae bacterium]
MIEKIKALEKTARLLDPSQNQRNQWNEAVLQYADTFINQLTKPQTFVDRTKAEGDQTHLEIGEEANELPLLLTKTTAQIDNIGLNPAAPGHMAYIPGGGLYPSALGDYIAAVTNRYAGIFYTAPGAVRLENALIRWMCSLFGYPKTAVGNLTSGGSIANLVAIVTAREAFQIKSVDIPNVVIYLSAQTHHSIQKAIRIAGLSEAHLRYIPLDDQMRMSANELEKSIIEDQKNGLKPFFLSAALGATNTGAIDPIATLASIAKRHKLWFHVDAAYGGFFSLVSSLQEKFEGTSEADSITLDPHKTLFLPFGTGTILIKEKSHVLKAHHYLADYMQDTFQANEEISPADISPELTKHFRGMRLWLPLKLFGLKPFRAALEEKLYLTRYFYKIIQLQEGFEVGPEPELSVAIFRYLPQREDPNTFNQKLIQAIQKDGRVFLSSTTIKGTYWIRIAVVSFRTHLAQVDLLLTILQEKVAQLKN